MIPIKILWHSVAPWAPTGYGTQTGQITPRLRDMGHDVALSVYYGLQGAEMSWNGMRCYPSYSAPYGADVIVPHALHHFGAEKARSIEEASTMGIILTLGDVWTFESPLLDQLCVGAWTPVDHLQVPEVTAGWLGVMGAVPIAMSRFGETVLREAGLHPLYAPHGIDTAVFCPGDKTRAREVTGLPGDVFVVGMVANNVGRDGNRKAFSEQIRAFAELHKRHRDTMLILHTDVDQPSGMRLRSFLEGHLPKGSYTYTDIYTYRKGLNPSAVADIYRAADVLTNCSYGEGFGIPVMEAQACGTPVVVTDATAMSELCGAGWRVGYEEMWHDSQGAWAAVPRIGDIVDAYEQAYEKARDEAMRAEAYAFAQNYDADVVAGKYWRPILATFEGLLERKREELAAKAAAPRKRLREQIREADGLVWIDRGAKTGDGIGWKDHETQLRPILDQLLPWDGVFVDVGAHVGHWTLRLAERASQVVAVEANPATAATLRRHIAMNGLGNVTVVELAAWDEASMLYLDDPNGQIEGGSTRTVPIDDIFDDRYAVPAGRLDEQLELAGLDRIDLIKLDVEGADIHALRGMAGLLGKYQPVLFIECHDIYGYYTRAELEQTLTDLGYGFEVAASVMSQWMPTGYTETPQQADYLVARPT